MTDVYKARTCIILHFPLYVFLWLFPEKIAVNNSHKIEDRQWYNQII